MACSTWTVRSLAALDEEGVKWLVEQMKDAFILNISVDGSTITVTQGDWSTVVRRHAGTYDPETKTMDFSGGTDE